MTGPWPSSVWAQLRWAHSRLNKKYMKTSGPNLDWAPGAQSDFNGKPKNHLGPISTGPGAQMTGPVVVCKRPSWCKPYHQTLTGPRPT